MKTPEWEAVWKVIEGSWPSQYLQDQTVKAEWSQAFSSCQPAMLIDAVRNLAKKNERPSVAGLFAAYLVLSRARTPALPAAPIPDAPATGDAWEANYHANLVATQRQLAHEIGCVACRTYATAPAPDKDHPRVGRPCPIGMAYWRPHYEAGMPRPG